MRYLSQVVEVKKKIVTTNKKSNCNKKPTNQNHKTHLSFSTVHFSLIPYTQIWARQNVSDDVKRSMKPQHDKRTPDIHSIYNLNVRKSSKVAVLRGTTISVMYITITPSALPSAPTLCQSPNATFPQSFSNDLIGNNPSSKYYKTA